MAIVRTICSNCLFVSALLVTVPYNAAQSTNNSTHIEIVLQSRNQDSSDTRREIELYKHNLQLSMGNSKIPFGLTGAKKGLFATHLLIVLPGPLADCANTPTPEGLSSLLGPGWSLALAGSDGRWTQWTSGPNAWSSACASSSEASSSSINALLMLQSQIGRRILLYAEKQPQEELQLARKMLPEIYVVDGGALVRTRASARAMAFPSSSLDPRYSAPNNLPSSSADHAAFSPEYGQYNDPANHWVLKNQVPSTSKGHREEGHLNGEMHTKSMQHAFKAIQQASDLYYDLAFAMPASTASASLELRFKFMPGFRAYTALYSDPQNTRRGSNQRATVPASLVVLE